MTMVDNKNPSEGIQALNETDYVWRDASKDEIDTIHYDGYTLSEHVCIGRLGNSRVLAYNGRVVELYDGGGLNLAGVREHYLSKLDNILAEISEIGGTAIPYGEWSTILEILPTLEIKWDKEKEDLRRTVNGKMPTPSQLELLVNPKLFEKIIEESERKAVGETLTKMNLVIAGAIRLVENIDKTSSNFVVNDLSGAGKDYLTRSMLSLVVPANEYQHRTRISPTAFTYWHNPKDEPDWTWDGKVIYLEDISEAVFNSEVLKTMMSGGAKSTITVNHQSQEIEIRGKPTIIMTFANVTPNTESLRRIQTIPMDTGDAQTKRIKEFKASVAKNGIVPDYNPYLTDALAKLERVKVIVPFAEKIAEAYPDELISRTSLDRLFDYIKAVTALYQFQREKDENGCLIATKQDYEIARKAYLYCIGGDLKPLVVNQRRILQHIQKKSVEKYGRKDAFLGVNEFLEGAPLSKSNLYSNMGELVNAGFLKCKSQSTDLNREIQVFQVVENNKFTLPDFEGLFVQEAADVSGGRNINTEGTDRRVRTNETIEIEREHKEAPASPEIPAKEKDSESHVSVEVEFV